MSVIAVVVFIAVSVSERETSGEKYSTLSAPRVRVGVNDLILRVTNEGTENWSEMVIYLNGRPPFTYKWEGPTPAIGQSVTIPLREFVKENGERFDAYRMKAVEAWIGGSGHDYQGLRF
jgi:hypothetical protein